ncbi:hypothetical protein EsH8_XI_000109 [Colletotrichum jinshuiense]
METPWQEAVASFVGRSSHRPAPADHTNHRLADEYFSLEQSIVDTHNVRPVDVRAELPNGIVAGLVAV